MCLYCHRDDPALDTGSTYAAVHAAAHGDGNADCIRKIRRIVGPPFWGCIDCGDQFDNEQAAIDHCCYDGD